MSGHQLRMTHHENGERNVFEPDHYADKSFWGTHYWNLCWKLTYLTSEKKLKIKCPDMTNGIDLRIFPLQSQQMAFTQSPSLSKIHTNHLICTMLHDVRNVTCASFDWWLRTNLQMWDVRNKYAWGGGSKRQKGSRYLWIHLVGESKNLNVRQADLSSKYSLSWGQQCANWTWARDRILSFQAAANTNTNTEANTITDRDAN